MQTVAATQSSVWSTRQIRIDTKPPTASFVSLTNYAYINVSSFIIQLSADDVGGGVSEIQLFVHYNGASQFWNYIGNASPNSNGWSLNWDASAQPDQAEIGFAAIVFDHAGNRADLNVSHIQLDRTPPDSSVQELPLTSFSDFYVVWISADHLSGVDTSDIQYQDNGGTWTDWYTKTNLMFGRFTGTVGHTYGFRSRARDKAGNVGNWPANAQTFTTVVDQPTLTMTPTPTSTTTASPIATLTATATASSTVTPMITNSPMPASTMTATPTRALTATATASSTLTPTAPVPHIDTIGIYRNGNFYLRLANSIGYADLSVTFNPAIQPYPIVGDWTGSNYDQIGVFDQSNGLFSLCTFNDSTMCANHGNVKQLVLGVAGDIPLAGRWQPNAPTAGVGVFRPSNGLIYLKNALSTGYADYTMVLGLPGDVGLAGDWTGQGFDSPGVYRPSMITFFLSNQVTNGSVFGDETLQYGFPGDSPVVGDWIGQGHDGVGLFRPTNGYTYLRNTLTTGYADNTFVYGIAGDIPVAGHWQIAYPGVPQLNRLIVISTSSPLLTPTATSKGPRPTLSLGNFDG